MAFTIIFPNNVSTNSEYGNTYLSKATIFIHGTIKPLINDQLSNRAEIIANLVKTSVVPTPDYLTLSNATNNNLISVLQPQVENGKNFFKKKFPLLMDEKLISEEIGVLKEPYHGCAANSLVYERVTNLGSLVIFRRDLSVDPQTGRATLIGGTNNDITNNPSNTIKPGTGPIIAFAAINSSGGSSTPGTSTAANTPNSTLPPLPANLPNLEKAFPDAPAIDPSSGQSDAGSDSSQIPDLVLTFLNAALPALGPVGMVAAGITSVVNSEIASSQAPAISSAVSSIVSQNDILTQYSNFESAYTNFGTYMKIYQITSVSSLPDSTDSFWSTVFTYLQSALKDPTSELMTGLSALQNEGGAGTSDTYQAQSLQTFELCFSIYLSLFQYYLNIRANEFNANKISISDYFNDLNFCISTYYNYINYAIGEYNALINKINQRLSLISGLQSGTSLNTSLGMGDGSASCSPQTGLYYTDSYISGGVVGFLGSASTGLPSDMVNFIPDIQPGNPSDDPTPQTALAQQDLDNYIQQQTVASQSQYYFTASTTICEAINSWITTHNSNIKSYNQIVNSFPASTLTNNQ